MDRATLPRVQLTISRTAVGATNRGPPYGPHCWTQLSTVDQPWRGFSTSRIVRAKMDHVSPTPPLWGYFSSVR